jgi:hypothetical protein
MTYRGPQEESALLSRTQVLIEFQEADTLESLLVSDFFSTKARDYVDENLREPSDGSSRDPVGHVYRTTTGESMIKSATVYSFCNLC